MRKVLSFMMLSLMAVVSLNFIACSDDDEKENDGGSNGGMSGSKTELTLHVKTGGRLPYMMDDNTKYTTKSLKLTGWLNGTDIRCIREMGELEYLDIEDCKIVEGGLWYDDEHSTKYNIIGEAMFANMRRLKNIKLPETTTLIAHGAFRNCSSLASITIPENTIVIESVTFKGCSSLKEIIIPHRVETIGASAFEGCKSLTTITIPNSVTYFWENVFKDCSNLVNVIFEDGSEDLEYQEGGHFENCPIKTLYIGRNCHEYYDDTRCHFFTNTKTLETVKFGKDVRLDWGISEWYSSLGSDESLPFPNLSSKCILYVPQEYREEYYDYRLYKEEYNDRYGYSDYTYSYFYRENFKEIRGY